MMHYALLNNKSLPLWFICLWAWGELQSGTVIWGECLQHGFFSHYKDVLVLSFYAGKTEREKALYGFMYNTSVLTHKMSLSKDLISYDFSLIKYKDVTCIWLTECTDNQSEADLEPQEEVFSHVCMFLINEEAQSNHTKRTSHRKPPPGLNHGPYSLGWELGPEANLFFPIVCFN